MRHGEDDNLKLRFHFLNMATPNGAIFFAPCLCNACFGSSTTLPPWVPPGWGIPPGGSEGPRSLAIFFNLSSYQRVPGTENFAVNPATIDWSFDRPSMTDCGFQDAGFQGMFPAIHYAKWGSLANDGPAGVGSVGATLVNLFAASAFSSSGVQFRRGFGQHLRFTLRGSGITGAKVSFGTNDPLILTLDGMAGENSKIVIETNFTKPMLFAVEWNAYNNPEGGFFGANKGVLGIAVEDLG